MGKILFLREPEEEPIYKVPKGYNEVEFLQELKSKGILQPGQKIKISFQQ